MRRINVILGNASRSHGNSRHPCRRNRCALWLGRKYRYSGNRKSPQTYRKLYLQKSLWASKSFRCGSADALRKRFLSGLSGADSQKYGKGHVYYVAADMEAAFYEDFLGRAAEEAGVEMPLTFIPEGVSVTTRKMKIRNICLSRISGENGNSFCSGRLRSPLWIWQWNYGPAYYKNLKGKNNHSKKYKAYLLSDGMLFTAVWEREGKMTKIQKEEIKKSRISLHLPGNWFPAPLRKRAYQWNLHAEIPDRRNGLHQGDPPEDQQEIFQKPEELMENIAGVTGHLKKKVIEKGGDLEREVLNLIPTKRKSISDRWERRVLESLYFYYRCGKLWSGGKTGGFLRKCCCIWKISGNAGWLSGRDSAWNHKGFPWYKKRFQALKDAVEKDCCHRAASVKEEIAFALQHEDLAGIFGKLLENGKFHFG